MARERKAVTDIKQSSRYKAIRQNLLDQLKTNDISLEVFIDSVDDYMALYVTKRISNRGVLLLHTTMAAGKKERKEMIRFRNSTNVIHK